MRITDLLFYSLQFLEEYDCETVGMSPTNITYAIDETHTRQGDPQTAFSHLGDVVLFVQYVLAKYKVGCKIIFQFMCCKFSLIFMVSLKIKI